MAIAHNAFKYPIIGQGFEFKMIDPDSRDIIFNGDLTTKTCAGNSKNGNRCKRKVTLGLPYCFQHRKSVQSLTTKESQIPNAGKGLFVNSKDHEPNEIVFRNGDKIVNYDGEVLPEREIDNRYGDYTAPYALQLPNDRFIDAALVRGLGSHANSKATLSQCNAKLTYNNQGVGFLKATKNIRNGSEIFVYYGKGGYNFDSIHSTRYKPPLRRR